MATFLDTKSNSGHIDVNGTYNLVDYDAPLSQFSIHQNNVTVSQSTLGNDTLKNIDWLGSSADISSRSIIEAISLANDALIGVTRTDLLNGDAENDRVDGGNGNDDLQGGIGNDILNGNAGADTLRGNAGHDILNGGIGEDVLFGGTGHDVLNGGKGADTLNGNNGHDRLNGGTGNDTLYGGAGSDRLDGGNGNDDLQGGIGNDVLNGNAGADSLRGNAGHDILNGGIGEDDLFGGTGHDVLNGGKGADTLNGNNGHDRLNGGTGNDTLYGDFGSDHLNGGDGHDNLHGGIGNDVLNGNAGADTLRGNAGHDILNGGRGADTLFGGTGHDVLNGGKGADTLNGGNGHDTLTGGAGRDTFMINRGDGHDDITDFQLNHDKIDLSKLDVSFEDLNITTNEAGHVRIIISETQSILLSNLSNPNDLDANDFIFADNAILPVNPVIPEYPAPEPEAPDTGTTIDGIITGSNDVDDFLNGDAGDNTFFAGRGTDVINGGAGNDTLNVDGDIIEWTFSANADGSVTMTHPTWGQNTLVGIEQIFSQRAGETFSIDDAIAMTDGLPRFRLDNDNVINGTNGDDNIRADADVQGFYGGTGDDVYFGTDNFEQVNYDGARSEYTITQNDNGSITVEHPIWGTDTLNNIDGLLFTGVEPGADADGTGIFEFISPDDLFA